jgi:hypothetical protein
MQSELQVQCRTKGYGAINTLDPSSLKMKEKGSEFFQRAQLMNMSDESGDR